MRLSPKERLRLIEEVWDSLASELASIPADGSELEELERRRARYLADPSSLRDWEELKSRLLRPRPDAH